MTAPLDSLAGALDARGPDARDHDVLAVLLPWLPAQRWFPAKGTDVEVEHVAVLPLADPEGEAEVALHLLRMPGGALLQVPVVLRAPSAVAADAAVVGVMRGGEQVPVVDGCHDAAALRAWLAAATYDDDAAPLSARGPGEPGDLAGARVLSGEQSNTSVVLPSARPPAILKVFRGVSAGANPDVEIPLALHHVGWTGAPRPLAWLTARWSDSTGEQRAHLGVLSELVLGAEDGFELACRLAGEGSSMAALAASLGARTAQMHHALRGAVPVSSDGRGELASDADAVVATLQARAAAAIAAAPVLREQAREERIAEVLGQVGRLGELPPVQRVHGDYHLGQVLHSVDRGWSVLDFEGEPQASAEERTRPDLALRDLAGMLRSFDYAAAVGGATNPGWALQARDRLVEGYAAEAGDGGLSSEAWTALLRALELDKALYEVVYESRNRPTWIAIPLRGVDRLLDQA